MGSNGNLIVSDGKQNSVWSTNVSFVSYNSTAILLDSGNFILTELTSSGEDLGNSNEALWQSFDDPTDTFIPGMKISLKHKNGENHLFTSWKTESEPSKGNFSIGIDPRGEPQIVIMEKSKRHWRSGLWDGQKFLGDPNMRSLYLYGFKLSNTNEDGGIYFTYTLFNSSEILRFRIRWDGREEHLRWDEGKKEWSIFWTQPATECELYNKCGPYGRCSKSNLAICSCLHGFEPKSIRDWSRRDWSGGCVRKKEFQCERNNSSKGMESDGFLELKEVNLPDLSDWKPVENRNKCEDQCLKNCSCTAYAYVIGIGCLIWDSDLVDIQQLQGGGDKLYIRLAHSEVGTGSKISKAVGQMPCGTKLAVKRLEKNSGQGLEEFKTEILLIARLQHRNLVRLLGYCVQEDEKILVYEYLPNKSLDAFIFDFGMAKIFRRNENKEDTNRVVGTYGYMSPEYANEGLFSMESDVYSFGVILLEIAWHLWSEGKAMELIDPSLGDSCSARDVLRCIHVNRGSSDGSVLEQAGLASFGVLVISVKNDPHKLYRGLNGGNDFKHRKMYKILVRKPRWANLRDDGLNHAGNVPRNVARRTSDNFSSRNSVGSNNLSEDTDGPPVPQFAGQNSELDGSLYEGGSRPIGQKLFRKNLTIQKALHGAVTSGSGIQTMLDELRLEKRQAKAEKERRRA
ncbi:hypothetical protein GIB67_032675 [Kingdonia uniflora]|uniref:Receptor-like serine/threonine-protein kinase n=1 Tax=Kingdonia uniflora TaxID=39325 RepID=A0A7J7MWI4_9MAGN|nr:hypothetical protein GIB67_032675 [Kingdonia uniflora]